VPEHSTYHRIIEKEHVVEVYSQSSSVLLHGCFRL
jgi:hypothetical protein